MPVTCSTCNAVNKDGHRFCQQCGAALPATQPQAQWLPPAGMPRQRSPLPRTFVLGITIGAVCLALVVIVMLTRNDAGGDGGLVVVGSATAVPSIVAQASGTPQPAGVATAVGGATPDGGVPTASGGATPDGGVPTASGDSPTPVTDGPHVVALQDSVTFEDQDLNTTSGEKTITLSNEGGAAQPLGTPFFSGTNPNEFAVSRNRCGDSLDSVTNCELGITFTPSSNGDYSATLEIIDAQGTTVVSVSVKGTGGTSTPSESVSVSPYSLDFGSQNISTSASSNITVTNNGTAAVGISNVTLDGDTSVFSMSNGCSSSLDAGASCSIAITFAPSTATSSSGTVTVTDDANNTLGTVSLTGLGYDPNPSGTGGDPGGSGSDPGGSGGSGSDPGGSGGSGSDPGGSGSDPGGSSGGDTGGGTGTESLGLTPLAATPRQLPRGTVVATAVATR